MVDALQAAPRQCVSIAGSPRRSIPGSPFTCFPTPLDPPIHPYPGTLLGRAGPLRATFACRETAETTTLQGAGGAAESRGQSIPVSPWDIVMGKQVALYGGSFNPVHCGHVIIARSMAEQLALERVVFLPSASPPHKEADDLADASHRAEMIHLAIAGDPRFELSDYDLTREGPTYTYDTVQHFRDLLGPRTTLCWMIGADSLVDLPNWYRATELVDQCMIITACRPGWDVIDWTPLEQAFEPRQCKDLRAGLVETPRIDISSTQVRDRCAAGRSIRWLVPDAVAEYIKAHNLYTEP
jgi:nicotinate-nucleotide adenylyltransferase